MDCNIIPWKEFDAALAHCKRMHYEEAIKILLDVIDCSAYSDQGIHIGRAPVLVPEQPAQTKLADFLE